MHSVSSEQQQVQLWVALAKEAGAAQNASGARRIKAMELVFSVLFRVKSHKRLHDVGPAARQLPSCERAAHNTCFRFGAALVNGIRQAHLLVSAMKPLHIISSTMKCAFSRLYLDQGNVKCRWRSL